MKRLWGFASLVAACALIGCGGSGGSEGASVYPTSGTVTMKGEALAGATVAFSPVGSQPTATGTTDAEGKFELTTYELGDGAAEGSYKVIVSKSAAVAATSSADSESSGESAHEAEADAATSHNAASADAEDLVPANYRSAETTPLTAEVKSSGDNVFTFEIE